VALAAHDRFGDLVRDAGLEHRTLPGDPAEDWAGLAALLTDLSWLPGPGHVLVVTRA